MQAFGAERPRREREVRREARVSPGPVSDA
jgi:hypothetical protein